MPTTLNKNASLLNALFTTVKTINTVASMKRHFNYKSRIGDETNPRRIVKVKNTFKIVPSKKDGEFEKRVINEFNNLPQVKVVRTHGRTTSLERMQIAYFGNCIADELVARKFDISTTTVRHYARETVFWRAF